MEPNNETNEVETNTTNTSNETNYISRIVDTFFFVLIMVVGLGGPVIVAAAIYNTFPN